MLEGSSFKGRGWFASQINFNEYERGFDLFGSKYLRKDVAILSKRFGIQCFYFGPPLWMFGKPYDEDGKQRWKLSDFNYLLESFFVREINASDILFRVRLNVHSKLDHLQYCSPPDEFRKKFGRFDSKDLPIQYCAFDVETCLHESRVTVADEVFLAWLAPTQPLQLLDLTECTASPESPFEDPQIWLRALIYDSADSYSICRRLAKRIKKAGFSGFIYPSYFQQVTSKTHKNVALFGRPIREGKVAVNGVNKVVLKDVAYDYSFGPAIESD